MKFNEQLNTYLRARFPLILVVTQEEERCIEITQAICERSQRALLSWDLADGFRYLTKHSISPPDARDPFTALEKCEMLSTDNPVFLLRDFHESWTNPLVKRKLRSVCQKIRTSNKTIIISSPTAKIPEELRDEIVLIELPLPKSDELEDVLSTQISKPGVKVNLTPLGREKMVQAALGLTVAQAQRVYAKAIVSDGVLDDRDIDLVTEEKKQIIRESEALEFFPVTETPDDIGGLGVLKEWLHLRERAFSKEARDYGLPAPKGIALIGIPGTGKSLTAKMIGGLWRLPLLRLDIGALYGSLVGESEEHTRRALRLAETVAPCILWIDELEKSISHGGADAGTSSRVFGSILTWMQEKKDPVFVVATANDIYSLPPELLRRGRFDEIFFLDLPTPEERREILYVHLIKRRRIPEDYNLDVLVSASEGYVGSEIEQAIIDAMYIGFDDHQREFTTDDILKSFQRQVPLSVSQRENITLLRNWLREGRARSASFAEPGDAVRSFVKIDEKSISSRRK